MAQNELPTFYGERTKDGNTIQRTVENNADSEPVVMPSSPVPKPQPAHEPRRIEFQPQDAGHPRHRSRYDNDFEEHRRLPHRSESVQYDYWDRAARRRAARDRYDRDVDSGYEDYYGDRRSMTDDFRRRRSTRTSRPPMSRFNGDHAGSYPENTGGETPLQIDAPLRLPWTMWMNSDIKNHFVAAIGEFVGTTMFLFFAFSGTQVANIDSGNNNQNTTSGGSTGFNPTVLLYIALVFGFSLMVNVWIFFRISGGLFNPAVTLAMVLTKTIPPIRAFLLLAMQVAGSIFASYLVSVLFPTPLNVRTTLAGGTTIAQGIFIEAVLTAELVFTIFMLAKEKHKATFMAPVGIGLALFVGELTGVFYTGGSLNPARSLGPCVVTGIFDSDHWVYWVGPAIGAILAVVFYKFIKILEYEMANPNQDGDNANDPTQNPNHEVNIEHARKQGQS